MEIHDFIVNTLREIRRAIVSTGEASSATSVELDFPVSIGLTRKQPGEHTLEVPPDSPTGSGVARLRISLTLSAAARAQGVI